MSNMPLGNVNIQHFNRKWILSKDWELSFAMSTSSKGKMSWTSVGQVSDCQVVQKKVGFTDNLVPVLCFYIDGKGKVPVGMDPMKIDIKNFEISALAGAMATVVPTKSPGKIASK